MLNITNHQGIANQNPNEVITSHLLEWLLLKIRQVLKRMDEKEFFFFLNFTKV